MEIIIGPIFLEAKWQFAWVICLINTNQNYVRVLQLGLWG